MFQSWVHKSLLIFIDVILIPITGYYPLGFLRGQNTWKPSKLGKIHH